MQLRRIESDAEDRCRDCRCRRNHSSMRLRRIESDAEHRCRNNCCRRNHSPLASIRKSRPEIKNRCTDCPCFDLLAASIHKSGLEIENRCMDCPYFDLLAALIRKSGPEIRNRCNTIDAASRTVPPAEGRCRYNAASDSNLRRRKVERSASDSNLRRRKVERSTSDSNLRCGKEDRKDIHKMMQLIYGRILNLATGDFWKI